MKKIKQYKQENLAFRQNTSKSKVLYRAYSDQDLLISLLINRKHFFVE